MVYSANNQGVHTHEARAVLHHCFRAGSRGGFHTYDPNRASVAWVSPSPQVDGCESRFTWGSP